MVVGQCAWGWHCWLRSPPQHGVPCTACDVCAHLPSCAVAAPFGCAEYACPPQSAFLPYLSHALLPAFPDASTCESSVAAGTHFVQALPAYGTLCHVEPSWTLYSCPSIQGHPKLIMYRQGWRTLALQHMLIADSSLDNQIPSLRRVVPAR